MGKYRFYRLAPGVRFRFRLDGGATKISTPGEEIFIDCVSTTTHTASDDSFVIVRDFGRGEIEIDSPGRDVDETVTVIGDGVATVFLVKSV